MDEDGGTPAALPIAFRGYARGPVDDLLAEIEVTYRALIAERDELQLRLASAEQRLSEVTREFELQPEQRRVVSEAAVAAAQRKAGNDDRTNDDRMMNRGAEAIDVEKIMRNARAETSRLFREIRRTLQERRKHAEQFLDPSRSGFSELEEDSGHSASEREVP